MTLGKVPDEDRPRCSEPGCDGLARKRGMCVRHYRRRKIDGTLPDEWLSRAGGKLHRVARGKTCSVSGCGMPSMALGMCNRHYLQERVRSMERDKPPAEIGHQLDERIRESESFGSHKPPWERHPIPWD